MKQLLLIVILLLSAVAASAQVSQREVLFVISDPTVCSTARLYFNRVNGTLWANDGLGGTGCVQVNSGAGGGAPTTATFITQTANGTLSAEQALGLLSSGILRVATTTGVVTSLGDVLPTANGGFGADVSAAAGVPLFTAGTPAFTSTTGTGTFVRSGSPTLTTPNLGTPSALVGTNITGTAAGLTAGTVTTNANLTGPVTSVGNATTITNNSVTGAMIALGSDAQGDVMYYNGTDWVRLAAGTNGQFLQTQGAAANPQWATPAGSGDMLLGTAQTVTAAKTFNVGTLKIASGGDLVDANGNELFKFTATASAVNEITVANAATGSGPTITASGGDTNIDVTIAGKGTGKVVLGTPGASAGIIGLPDTDGSHLLNITPGSNLTADRILTLTTGDAARTITLSGNPTLADWFDQSVKTTASPTFVDVTVTTEAYDATGWNGDNTVPTKDAVRDKIETMGGGGSSVGTIFSAQNGNNQIAASTTQACSPEQSTACSSSGNFKYVQLTVPTACTARDLYVRGGDGAQPASGSLVVTLFKNNASTTLTATIAANAAANTTASDTSNTVSVAGGDKLHLQVQNNATASSTGIDNISFRCN